MPKARPATGVWIAAAVALAMTAAAPVHAETVPTKWGSSVVRQPADWYASAEARRIADTLLLYQSTEGGWPKNTDMMVAPAGPLNPDLANTFDNEGTILPLTFLARVIAAGGETPARRAAFDRGLDYVLAAQYPSGGWPQFFPLRSGYYSHITFNDDAMVRILSLVSDVAAAKHAYAFVDPARRARAAEARTKGLDVILKTQIVQDGRLTVWCAQHDETTLAPAWARRFEPPSLSGYESVGITRFLMAVENPSPEIIAAVEGAVVWFKANAIPDIAVERFTDAAGHPDRRVVPAPGQTLWARFYELGTNRPVFIGRDSVLHASLAEIEQERRAGYNYFDASAARLIDADYPAWRARLDLAG